MNSFTRNYSDVNWVFDADLSTRNISGTEISQMFDQMVLERSLHSFESIFTSIKEKIFAINDPILISPEEIEIYKEKYNISDTVLCIETLKKNISTLYQNKIKIDNKIDNSFKKYNDFLQSLSDFTEKMQSVVEIFTDQDQEFKDTVHDRIEWYYKQLGLEELLNEQKSITNEYNYLLNVIKGLSEITNPCMCQICYTNQVSFYLNPCGHTLCESCKNKYQISKNCHYCRTSINSFNKLFL